MNPEIIGNFIRKLREDKHITQEELSERIGVSPKTISKWETGVSVPEMPNLESLSGYFDVTVNELIAGEKNISQESADENIVNVATYYKKNAKSKIKKLIIFIVLLIAIIIFLLSNLYFFNNYDNSKLYSISGSDSNYATSGYLVINPVGNLLIIEHVRYQGELFGTDKEPKVKDLTISFNIDKKNYINYGPERNNYVTLSDLLDTISFSIREENKDEVNAIDTKKDLRKLTMEISYYDEEDNFVSTELKLSVAEIYSNNKFFYN